MPDAPHPTPVDPAEVREVLAKEAVAKIERIVDRWVRSAGGFVGVAHPFPWFDVADALEPLASLSAPVPPEPQLSDTDRIRVERARGPLTGFDDEMTLAAGLDSLIDILDRRFPPPACPCCGGPLRFDEANKPIGWGCDMCSSGYSADFLRDADLPPDFRCFRHPAAPPSSIDTSTEGGES